MRPVLPKPVRGYHHHFNLSSTRLAEMDFTSPAKKVKLYSSSSPAVLSLPSFHKSSNPQALPPSSSELGQFYKKLSEESTSVLLSIIPA